MKLEKKKKRKQKINIQPIKKKFIIFLNNLFLKILFVSCKNSNIDNTPKTIKQQVKIKLKLNIKITMLNNNSDVTNLAFKFFEIIYFHNFLSNIYNLNFLTILNMLILY